MGVYLLAILADACDDVGVLRVILFLKNLINYLFILVPAGAILMLSVDMAKNVTSSNVDEQRKNMTMFIRRCIYLLVIFLIPSIVNFFVSFLDEDSSENSKEFMKCMNVTSDRIESLAKQAKKNCLDDYEWDSTNNICVFVGEKGEGIEGGVFQRRKKAVASTSPVSRLNRTFEGSRSKTMMEYSQGDPRWSTVGLCYANNPMHTWGCGFTALTMIVTGYGNDPNATPKTLRDYYCNTNIHNHNRGGMGGDELVNPTAMAHYGLIGAWLFRNKRSSVYNEALAKQIKDVVDAGYAVIIYVPGHYIAVDKGSCPADKVFYYEASSLASNGCMTMKGVWDHTWNRFNRCLGQGNCGWGAAWKYKPATTTYTN